MNDTSSPKAGLPLKVIGIGLLVALIIAAGLYFYGVSQGNAKVAAQKTEYEQKIAVVQDELTKSKSELAVERDRGHLLQGQVELYKAVADLDARNFGLANTDLQKAASALAAIDPTTDAVPAAQITKLRGAIEQTDINVAVNLAGQRAKVVDFIAQLEKLKPAAAPASEVTIEAPIDAESEPSAEASPEPTSSE